MVILLHTAGEGDVDEREEEGQQQREKMFLAGKRTSC